MSVIRVNKTKDYTVMSNFHLRDKQLSLKAKGLLSIMLSLPDNWDYSIKGLVAIVKENETAVESALKELKEFGYLRIDKIAPDKSVNGRWEYVYNVFEAPQKQGVEKQGVEILPLEILGLENHPQLNTNKSNTDKQNTKNKKGFVLADEVRAKMPRCSDNLIGAIQSWLDYKKEKRQSYTPIGLNGLLTRLANDYKGYGEQYVIDEIKHSIGNMYSGIFAQSSARTQNKKVEYQKHNYDKSVLEEKETPFEEML